MNWLDFLCGSDHPNEIMVLNWVEEKENNYEIKNWRIF